MSKERHSAYGQILKSSTIVGGSQAVGMILGFVRTKVLALILGPEAPAAVGLLGLFTTLTQLINTVAGLGASGSGVREISLAHSSGDDERFASVLKALRRLLLTIGIAGSVLMFAIAPLLSQLSFKSSEQSNAIRLLAITVLLANINVGQNSILQGRRMLRELALVGIWSSVLGTVGSTALYYWLGVQAIVPSLVLLAAISPIVGWMYSRRIMIKDSSQSWKETVRISKGIIHLGISFLTAGIVGIVVMWLVQLQVSRTFGETGLGHYSSAYRISGFVVGFILSAMMTDFFPRLTGASADKPEMSRLVNEQTEVGILMCLPILIGMFCLAEWVIPILYSKAFDPAIPIFRWLVLGCLGRVCSWPLGTVLSALGQAGKIFYLEVTSGILHLACVWLGIRIFGINGAGIAFFTLYLVCFIWVYFWMRSLIGFTYSGSCMNVFLGVLVSISLSVLSIQCLPWHGRVICGSIITLGTGIWSIHMLSIRLGSENKLIRRMATIPIARLILARRKMS